MAETVRETAMRRLAVLCLLVLAAMPAWAVDGDGKSRQPADMMILSDPARGHTMGKAGGDPVLLQQTPNGTVGKVGKDKVLLHKDGNGNTLGKVGDRKLFCHTDAATGLTLCK